MKNYYKSYIIKGFHYDTSYEGYYGDMPVSFKVGIPLTFKNMSIGFRIIKTL